MTPSRGALRAALAAFVGAQVLVLMPATAAPDEIRVMTGDLTEPGDVSLELHAASIRTRGSSGTRHLGQGLAEISYGVFRTVELSVQLPVSKEPGWRENGVNFELQYVAPHDLDAGPYWGARVELGRTRAPFERDVRSTIEFRPIVGYTLESWHAAFNAAVRAPLSGADRSLTWEPALKIARDVAARMRLGLEYYEQAAQRPGGNEDAVGRRRLALLVLDTKVRGVDLSVGAGRGVGSAADGPVLKFIAGFEL